MKYVISVALIHLFLSSVWGQTIKLETALQKGHLEAIRSLKYSPDGNYILSAGRDKTAILWQLSTGRQIRTFLGHTSSINVVAFSPDGNLIATGSADNSVMIWETATGNLVQKFNEHNDRITALEFSPDGASIASGGWDDSVQVWEIHTGKVVHKFPSNADKGLGYGISISWSADMKLLAIGNDNKTTEVFSTNTGKPIASLRFEPEGFAGGSANKSCFNADASVLYMASNHAGIYAWNTKTWKPIQTYQEQIDECKSLEQRNDLLLACFKSEVKIWNTTNAKQVVVISSDSVNINTATLSPDAKTIAVAGDDKLITIYSTETGKPTKVLKGLFNEANNDGLNYDYNSRWEYYIATYLSVKTTFALSPDGKYLAKGKTGSNALLIDLSNGRIVKELKGHQKVVIGFEFSPDGKWLLTTSGDKTAKLWDVATGKVLKTFEGHEELIFEAKFSHDMKSIITASWDATVRHWDIATGKRIAVYQLENGSAFSLAFSNNDAYFIAAGLDKKLRLFEMDSKQEVRNYIGHTDIVQTVAMSPDGKTFVSAGWDGRARLWDMATGLQKFKFTSHTDKVNSVAFNHSGEWIATGSADRTIKLWDANTGQELRALVGHTSAVSCLAFTPDKKYLISSSIDGIIKIWDLKSGLEKATYFTIGTKDWLVKTPEGYFDATDKMKEYIYFIKGKESYSIDQFFDEFYKPRLMKKLLSQALGEEFNTNLIDKIEKYPPPTVEFKSTALNEKTTTPDYTLHLKIIDNGGGIDEVKITHNGKRLPTDKQGMERAAKKGNIINLFVNVSLQSGINQIEVSGYSKGRVESKQNVKHIHLQSTEKKSTCYLLCVGINQYKNEAMNLNYAYADAKEFSEAIKINGSKLFTEVKSYTLYDGEATRQNIINRLVEISNHAKPEDIFIFYYAGHGSMIEDKFYFIPTEITRLYEEQMLQHDAIYAGDIQEILQNIKALKQVMVIDACHSGGSIELLAMRGGGEEKAIAQLARSAGIHVLASAGSEQTAGEFKTLGHGIFTYALLNALKGDADGAPKDGKVTVYELKSYLDDKVPELTNQYKNTTQYPHTFSKGNDFPIVVE